LTEENAYIRRCHEGVGTSATLTCTSYLTVALCLSDLGTRPSVTDLVTSATAAATTHTHMRTAATITLPVDVCDVMGHVRWSARDNQTMIARLKVIICVHQKSDDDDDDGDAHVNRCRYYPQYAQSKSTSFPGFSSALDSTERPIQFLFHTAALGSARRRIVLAT